MEKDAIEVEKQREYREKSVHREKEAWEQRLSELNMENKAIQGANLELEQKNKSLSNSLLALKEHQQDIVTQSKHESKQDAKQLHTILGLLWNLLSTVDSEISHFEATALVENFDWDKQSSPLKGYRPGGGEGTVVGNPLSSLLDMGVDDPPPLVLRQ